MQKKGVEKRNWWKPKTTKKLELKKWVLGGGVWIVA